MFDLSALLGSWYRGKGQDRFETGNPSQQVFNPFDIPTSLIDDMIARGVRPWNVETLDLSVAGQKTILTPGFHIVAYGHDGSAKKAVNTTFLIDLYWGGYSPGVNAFPLKNARGVSGPFQQITLKWAAQAGIYADIVIHSGMHAPWIDGETCT